MAYAEDKDVVTANLRHILRSHTFICTPHHDEVIYAIASCARSHLRECRQVHAEVVVSLDLLEKNPEKYFDSISSFNTDRRNMPENLSEEEVKLMHQRMINSLDNCYILLSRFDLHQNG
ncbi:hypothetical protein NDU88_005823 [Pleurodeles waltl]|uniref:Uncharacterized protein n=1 Tax=Pleurodeles waltl TaxID=8319 RepID=A0AAV7WWC3_PLEWA|nr:hypothetical protein NDU88_005823 [Pleurodeles waltl]